MAKKKLKKKTIRFPKKELNAWLRKHLKWDHQDWRELLSSLESQGFGDWVSSQEGQNKVGFYLESRRKPVRS